MGGGGGGIVGSIAGSVGRAVGGDVGRGISDAGNLVGDYVGILPNMIGGMVPDSEKPPAPPGIPASLSELQARQREKAIKFRGGLPELKKQTGQSLRVDAKSQMDADVANVEQGNASRGLLYGGINAGQKAGTRAQAQEGLLKATNQANAGLDQAADNLEAQALDTAFGIQQSQQNTQNMIYSQALAQMNSKNSMASGALGLMGTGLLKMGGM